MALVDEYDYTKTAEIYVAIDRSGSTFGLEEQISEFVGNLALRCLYSAEETELHVIGSPGYAGNGGPNGPLRTQDLYEMALGELLAANQVSVAAHHTSSMRNPGGIQQTIIVVTDDITSLDITFARDFMARVDNMGIGFYTHLLGYAQPKMSNHESLDDLFATIS
jgi:hypothetical protein